jgi:hypothetical protein
MATPEEEFVSSIPDFDGLLTGKQTDLLAYYALVHAKAEYVTGATLAALRQKVHLAAHPYLPQYLSDQASRKSGRTPHYVKKAKGYGLERGYAKALEAEHLGRPAAKHVSASLRSALAGISDSTVKEYLEEAISCFEHDLHRSAVVMSWCVAYGLFRAWIFKNHLTQLNAAMAAWKTPVKVSKLDDFQDLLEATVIETTRKIGVISREQQKTFRQLLDQRNSYAHPSAKPITPSFAEAYVETVLREVLPNFS